VSQYSEQVLLTDFQYINNRHPLDLSVPAKISFKIRHQPEFSAGTLIKEGDLHIISSEKPISGVAPGQFGVIYDEEKKICLGSGVITL